MAEITIVLRHYIIRSSIIFEMCWNLHLMRHYIIKEPQILTLRKNGNVLGLSLWYHFDLLYSCGQTEAAASWAGLTFLCYAVQKRELNATQALLCDLLCTIYTHSVVVLNSINTFMVNQFISCSSSRARCHRFFNFMLALLISLALCFHPKKGRERDGCLPCLYCWAEQLAP